MPVGAFELIQRHLMALIWGGFFEYFGILEIYIVKSYVLRQNCTFLLLFISVLVFSFLIISVILKNWIQCTWVSAIYLCNKIEHRIRIAQSTFLVSLLVTKSSQEVKNESCKITNAIGYESGSGRSHKFNIPSLLLVGFCTLPVKTKWWCVLFSAVVIIAIIRTRNIYTCSFSAFQLISVQDGVNCAGILRSINVLHIRRKPSN